MKLLNIKATLGEIKRHVRYKLGVKSLPHYLRPETRQERFSSIYETGVWQHGGEGVPGSGHGSTLAATKTLRAELPSLLRQLEAQTFLDVGCGDLTWMKEVDLPCEYVGADIVPSVIDVNRRQHQNDRRRFVLADAVTGDLPKADVVMCREVLFHLSLSDALAALRNIISRPRRFVMLTHDRETLFNGDIESGDFRFINLERAPFKLPAPFMEIADSDQKAQRVIGVWKAEQIGEGLSR